VRRDRLFLPGGFASGEFHAVPGQRAVCMMSVGLPFSNSLTNGASFAIDTVNTSKKERNEIQ
jgi:hypothetical protein